MAGIDLLQMNGTGIFMLVIYFLCLLIMARFVIHPILRTLVLRRERLAVTTTQTGVEPALAEKEARYVALVNEVRGAARDTRQAAREEAKRQERERMSEAQMRAQEIIRKGQTALAGDLATARHEMDALVPPLARELAHKLLGRELNA